MGTNPQAACGAPFESFVQPVIAYCANWNGRADYLDQVEEAKRALAATGLLNWGQFTNTDIRWCPLNGTGFAPQPGRILLNPSLRGNRVELAVTLGHEMKHMSQWREMGENGFKCGYSQEMLAGRGQGRANSIERAAYEFEDVVRQRVSAYYAQSQSSRVPPNFSQSPNPQPAMGNRCGTPYGACYTATYAPIGNPCWCPSQMGPIVGRTF
ncbi:MAG: hypothetical protein HOP13_15460 [Alphaproteobacteria bacterium]|nr:hypothetical protein [Alphaproteobacteria bacterium]